MGEGKMLPQNRTPINIEEMMKQIIIIWKQINRTMTIINWYKGWWVGV